ncbi:TetR/AcrR family transcriptional regulator [Pseudomonas fluorescens]|jgi:TetR/AcrR family transcriptional repressor of nem operon|uniref:TetR/AcrR family transcriptional regulator n=1 Tax=Pseudomonas fluorescens TaxID=294 RepID=UPI000CA390D8|nr:TetR/AcrR family transcriptional regulator [Pseudomonas fluorescens]AUM70565.1 TetR/AcrR family transcriptional regulator [Pseudomonas fluorescens]
MSDIGVAIMDAAERRIRVGGFNGFSFREIATDVGVKSSTVHYHFPTKELLAASVIHRYTERIAELIDNDFAAEPDCIKIWVQAFRGTIYSVDRMCPSTVLGAETRDLPDKVSTAVQSFFEMCLERMTTQGMTLEGASQLLSTIVGALLLANALGDIKAYDRATRGML